MSQEDTDDDEPDAEAFHPASGPGRMDIASQYIPESEDWEGKTVLDLSDPAAVSVLRLIGDLYPEVSELQEPIDEWLEHYLKTKTSAGGASREEYKDIIMALFGESSDDDSASVALQALAPEED